MQPWARLRSAGQGPLRRLERVVYGAREGPPRRRTGIRPGAAGTPADAAGPTAKRGRGSCPKIHRNRIQTTQFLALVRAGPRPFLTARIRRVRVSNHDSKVRIKRIIGRGPRGPEDRQEGVGSGLALRCLAGSRPDWRSRKEGGPDAAPGAHSSRFDRNSGQAPGRATGPTRAPAVAGRGRRLAAGLARAVGAAGQRTGRHRARLA